MSKISIGEFLVNANVITQEQLDKASELQRNSDAREKIGDVLVQANYLDKKTYLKYLAKYLQVPFIDLAHYKTKSELIAKLPENYARKFLAIFLDEEDDGGGGVTGLVGMVDPSDIFATDELARVLVRPIKFALVEEDELRHKLDSIYRRTSEISAFAEELAKELKDKKVIAPDENVRQSDYVVEKLIESLFIDAVQVGASDIHIEPAENVLRVRLRVDGLLQEQTLPFQEKSIAIALSQRLKLMAGLNIAEKRLPQDGGFNISVRSMPLDVRLSTMPSLFGESIVMRLLRRSGNIIDLNKIGMSKKMLANFRQLIKRPHGIILVTGPTGSGKTTTLYGALSEINDVAKKIITVEDPVEYKIERFIQVQINPQIDLSFAKVLKSILRQDPNIILIGEIRDQETASIALRAALTGQLVFATLHTNDAASTAIRLIDIGVEGYLVAATVRAVLAQRLVRRVCNVCTAPYELSNHEKVFIKTFVADATGDRECELPLFSAGAGCVHCNYSGYQGRVGVFELLEFDTEMLEALRCNNADKFARLASKNKMTTSVLVVNALELAKQGITTVAEVMRLAGE